MKTSIDYTVEDLLDGQLFIASKSKIVERSRFRTWMSIVAISFICAFIFYVCNNTFLTYYCIFFGLLTLLFYPAYQRRHYRRHYLKFVNNKFKNLSDLNYSIEIEKDTINTNSKIGNGSIHTSQIDSVTETGKYFFLGLSSGDTLTLPKRCFNYDALLTLLTDISNSNKININKELNWRWK